MIGSFPPEGDNGRNLERVSHVRDGFHPNQLTPAAQSERISFNQLHPCAIRASNSPPIAPPVKNSLTAQKLKRNTNTKKISI